MSNQFIRTRVADKVAWLTLNRPDQMNALNRGLIEEASAALQAWSSDPAIGCVVIQGEGRAFCAGGDIGDMAGREATTLEDAVDELRRGQEICWLLHSMPKITIAAVHGYAMGAGLGLALSCDLRIASEYAKFGTAYAKVGFGGDYGTTWKLTQLVGAAKAKELFVLADIVPADEALRIGLVNRVCKDKQYEETVNDWAARIANGPLVSYRYMKENINLAAESGFRAVLDREAFTHIRCGQTEDHKEGVAAFMEKRLPQFKGR
jgi:2-(1,2-epoxy-1,2-dihydrophenyl)acetyl-CoA isomerase